MTFSRKFIENSNFLKIYLPLRWMFWIKFIIKCIFKIIFIDNLNIGINVCRWNKYWLENLSIAIIKKKKEIIIKIITKIYRLRKIYYENFAIVYNELSPSFYRFDKFSLNILSIWWIPFIKYINRIMTERIGYYELFNLINFL